MGRSWSVRDRAGARVVRNVALIREHEFQFGSVSTRVCIGGGLLDSIGERCRAIEAYPRALVVTDDHVPARYAQTVLDSLKRRGVETERAVVPAGDASKSTTRANELYDRLAEWKVGRDGLIVAVGGGMVTDLTGFVGATWMRGVATVLCPTTLLADIDAAIGGKTGVNHPAGKNLIGAFHHPRLVLMDTDCLKTLSDRDFAAGMAESIKHAILTGEAFTAWLEDNASKILARDVDVLNELVERNVAIKAEIVGRDEKETTGERALLNLGHTVGHAIEAVSGFEFRHGECVALGLAAACDISERLGLLRADEKERIGRLLRKYSLATRMEHVIDERAVWAHLVYDKKARDGKVRFVLLEGLGRPVIHSNVSEEIVRSAITSLQPT